MVLIVRADESHRTVFSLASVCRCVHERATVLPSAQFVSIVRARFVFYEVSRTNLIVSQRCLACDKSFSTLVRCLVYYCTAVCLFRQLRGRQAAGAELDGDCEGAVRRAGGGCCRGPRCGSHVRQAGGRGVQMGRLLPREGEAVSLSSQASVNDYYCCYANACW